MYDLHCHSIYSDGAHTPLELIEFARAGKVKQIALTDHDSVSGVAEMQKHATKYGIKVIPGVEFSARWKMQEIHVLGLNIDTNNEDLTELINEQKHKRIVRAKMISQKLDDVGIKNIFEKLTQNNELDSIGRLHFANFLVEKKFCRDIQSAFKKYLGRGKCAYVAPIWSEIGTIIEVIKISGGLSVLAHPLKYSFTKTKLNKLLTDFKELGGNGCEIVSGMTTQTEIEYMNKLADEYGFLASSGSDFHCYNKSIIGIGRQAQLPLECKPIWHEF